MEDEDGDSFQLPAFNMLPMPVVDWSADPKSKMQIQCAEYCNGRLYVGSTDGKVFSYSLNKVSDFEVRGKSEANDAKSEGKSLGFGKKPVSCLVALPEIDRLIALCNEKMVSYSLSDMALRGALAKANGSTLMCVGKIGESFYIATFRKKKLAIFSLDMAGGKEGATLLREVELSDTPVRLCMCGDSVCVAYTHEYRLFKNIAEGPVAETQLFACDKTNPYIVTMENESMLLSAEDMAMIVNADGMPCGAPLTLNAQIPIAFGRSSPYVVALFQSSIDVFNAEKQKVVQTIPCPEQGLCVADAGAGNAGRGHKVFVASAKKIFCLDPVPFELQVGMLIDSFHIAQAFELFRQTLRPEHDDADEIARKAAKMRSDAGLALLSNLKFDQALQHLKRSPVDCRELLALLPDMVPSGFAYEAREEYNPRAKRGFDVKQMVEMALVRKTGNDLGADEQPMVVEELKAARKLIADFLNFKKADAAGTVDRRPMVDDRLKLDGEAPVKPQRLNAELLSTIDTVLLKLYVEIGVSNDDITAHLRTAGQRCNLSECLDALMVASRFTCVGVLYDVHSQVKKALEVWAKLGAGKLTEAGCDGVLPTVELLSKCDSQELVMAFSEWVLEKNPAEGVRIFAERSDETANLIDTKTVMSTLADLGAGAITRYLEYIIHQQGNTAQEYHTRLAQTYTQSALFHLQEGDSKAAEEVRVKLKLFLRESAHMDFEALLPTIKDSALVDELILLYRGMGQHDMALGVVVHGTPDSFVRAETYCLENKPAFVPGEVAPSLFTDLLRIYFAGDSEMQGQAMGILERYAGELNVVETLKLLPGTLSLSVVAPWLVKTFQAQNHKTRHLQVTRKLHQLANIRVQQKNAELGRSRTEST